MGLVTNLINRATETAADGNAELSRQAIAARPELAQYVGRTGLTGWERILQLESEGLKINDSNWVYSWLAEAGVNVHKYSFTGPYISGFERAQFVLKIVRKLILEDGMTFAQMRQTLEAYQKEYEDYSVFDGFKDFATSAPGALLLAGATAGLAGAIAGGAAAAAGAAGGSASSAVDLGSAASNLTDQIPKALGSVTADVIRTALPKPQRVASLVQPSGAAQAGAGGAALDPATGQPLNSGAMPVIILGAAIVAAYLIVRRKS